MMESGPQQPVQWNPAWFERQDESPDARFYADARKVVHIDDGAIRAATQVYRELLPAGGAILDLMSSWRSHLPADARYKRVAGLGMNSAEMQDNPQLTEHVVHDLNRDPRLPYGDREFDGACCTVSVQYLQRPVEVFREVGRVLKPGAPFVVTFSNRCFPTKAISLWLASDDARHAGIIALYFAEAGNWSAAQQRDNRASHSRLRLRQGDPLFAVWAYAK